MNIFSIADLSNAWSKRIVNVYNSLSFDIKYFTP
jgi:hypothetical protein